MQTDSTIRCVAIRKLYISKAVKGREKSGEKKQDVSTLMAALNETVGYIDA